MTSLRARGGRKELLLSLVAWHTVPDGPTVDRSNGQLYPGSAMEKALGAQSAGATSGAGVACQFSSAAFVACSSGGGCGGATTHFGLSV
jgi:hypothetical protein